jgi:hypothetical protein
MRILFTTQGQSLDMFHSLARELRERGVLKNAGYIVADSQFFDQWLFKTPDFLPNASVCLKEWEVVKSALDIAPDLIKLRMYERQLGGSAGLFGAIVSDRRILMGPDVTYSQDYRRRFTNEQLLSILLTGCEQIERLFDDFRPTHVIGFICVTFLDYLVYLFAKARGVLFLNLRPTRIQDKVVFSSTINDPSPEMVMVYQEFLKGGDPLIRNLAVQYIEQARANHSKYEGVITTSDKPAISLKLSKKKKFGEFISHLWCFYSGVRLKDNHVPDPLRSLIFHGIINPYRAKKMKKALAKRYVTTESLKKIRYIFFPLHTEPEISLLVYGRPFVNQIELLRMLAFSLPVDVFLVVKEHPWMVGKRKLSAYQKLLNIPKILLVDPKIQARNLIEDADAIAVITGSIGLEALVMRKPVLTFGDCPFNIFPKTMVTRAVDMRRLPVTIADMINNFVYDECALTAFVAASIFLGKSISLYSVLLGRKGVYTVNDNKDFIGEIKKLADYFLECNAKSNTTFYQDNNHNEIAAQW